MSLKLQCLLKCRNSFELLIFLIFERAELSKMKDTSEKVKSVTEKNRTQYEKMLKEYKGKIQNFQQCQDLYVKAFKELEHAIRKQKDAVSKGGVGNKMQKLSAKIQTQAVNLIKADSEYQTSLDQLKESQKNFKAKVQSMLQSLGDLEVERLECIRQGMGMFIACEEDSGYRSDMNSKHEVINIERDIQKFISEEPSLRAQPSYLFKNFEKLILSSQLFQMTEQGPVIIEEAIENNEAEETPSNDYRVIWDYEDPDHDLDALKLSRGDVVFLKELLHPDWGYGYITKDPSKREGYFPMNRVRRADLEKEAIVRRKNSIFLNLDLLIRPNFVIRLVVMKKFIFVQVNCCAYFQMENMQKELG
jgi:hypothetical protein